MHVSPFDKVAKHFQVIVIETLLTRSAHIICVCTSTAKYYHMSFGFHSVSTSMFTLASCVGENARRVEALFQCLDPSANI